MSDENNATQAVAVATTLDSVPRRPRASTSVPMVNLADSPNADDHNANKNCKQPLKRFILL